MVMSTTMRVQLRTRIGPTSIVRAGADEPSASWVVLKMHAHLILWADARHAAED